MSDIVLAASVSRGLLALPDLDINDHVNFYIAAQFWGAEETWERNVAGSPYVDGTVTVNRSRRNITQPVAVECLGSTQAALEANIAALKQAFYQDTFTLTVTTNSQAHAYACECADSTIGWTTGRIAGGIVQVVFQVPVKPIPLTGAF